MCHRTNDRRQQLYTNRICARKGRKMPTQVMNDSMNSAANANEIIVKTAYNGEKMITYINEGITFDDLCNEIRGMCRFSPDQVRLIIACDTFVVFPT